MNQLHLRTVMNLPAFISKKLTNSKENTFSASISRVAVVSILLSVSVLLLSFMILGGFKKEIKDKIFSLGGHLIISKYTLTNSYEDSSIEWSDSLTQSLSVEKSITKIQPYALKAALLKTNEEVQGIILKGVNASFDSLSFQKHLLEGRFVHFDTTKKYSQEIILSQYIANYLKLKVGDKVLLYFVQNPPRYRRVEVVGIYSTGLEDFDEKIIIGDLNLIRRINNWSDKRVTGVEIYLDDFNKTDEVGDRLFYEINEYLYLSKVTDKYSQLFDWLMLLDKNVIILLVIVLGVAATCMISILLILIMDRTQMIGLLKAIGAKNQLIRSVFIWNGMRLILKGMLIGNMIALFLGGCQKYFKIIPLNPKTYYMNYVPILIEWETFLLVNALTFILTTLTLLLPVVFISRINPVKAIKFS